MHRIALESFEESSLQTAKPVAEFTQGYSEGYAAGIDAAEAMQSALRSEIVQSIADLEFNYQEARGEITRSLAPLFSILIDKVFPVCISDRFSDQVVSILQQTMINNGTTDFKLSVSPIQHDAVTAALADTTINVEIIADSALSQNAAWIGFDQNELQVNCDQLLADIRVVLSSVDFIEIRSDTHGQAR